MIPFQRQVYEAIQKKEAEEQERRMQDAKGNSGSPPGGSKTPNSLAGSGGQQKQSMQGETIRYENESGGENPDANTSFVD